MRITCPNCSAQYEIEARLLPDEGREVQCSSCGHVWFQTKPLLDAPVPTPPRQTIAEPVAAAPVAAEVSTQAQETTTPVPAPTPRPPRPVDEKVLGILREEAEFEARAREAEQLETQPELGLMGTAPWPRQEPAEAPEEEEPEERHMPTAPAAFPDIDDISATLEPIGTARKGDDSRVELPATAQERNRSFVNGIIIPIGLGLVVIALYMVAPVLSSMVPALEPLLKSYVSAIDGLRTSLAQMLGR